MEISTETINILKNFSTINNGILVKPGSELQTISPQKNILAKAKVAEVFPVEFAIYDLTSLLGVLSMYKDAPNVEFNKESLSISGFGGRSTITYRYTQKSLVISPPEKELNLPSEDVSFTLSADDLNHLTKAAAVLQSPEVMIAVEDNKIYVSAVDAKNDAANVMRLHVGDADVSPFKVLLKTENMKISHGTYTVKISLQGIAKFTNADDKLTYWIATEAKSN